MSDGEDGRAEHGSRAHGEPPAQGREQEPAEHDLLEHRGENDRVEERHPDEGPRAPDQIAVEPLRPVRGESEPASGHVHDAFAELAQGQQGEDDEHEPARAG